MESISTILIDLMRVKLFTGSNIDKSHNTPKLFENTIDSLVLTHVKY